MEPSLLSGLFKQVVTTVITVGSMFYSTIDGVNATFSDVEVHTDGKQLFISTQLESCFTDDFDRILNSGKRIYFHYKVELYDQNKSIPIFSEEYFNAISFSHLDNIYEVYQSHEESFTSDLTLPRAKTLLASLQNVSLLSLDYLNSGTIYTVKVSSWLDKIKLEGMEEPINLMFYWSSLRPETQSNPFTRDQLNQ
ncbi:MAG: DUF4390 domain-containing protein [Candidatus Marinimicrobia bacterium]|nr:DUF4390 domain-containing protein [Candidatus Neomarinimicrobiota bacterium]